MRGGDEIGNGGRETLEDREKEKNGIYLVSVCFIVLGNMLGFSSSSLLLFSSLLFSAEKEKKRRQKIERGLKKRVQGCVNAFFV